VRHGHSGSRGERGARGGVNARLTGVRATCGSDDGPRVGRRPPGPGRWLSWGWAAVVVFRGWSWRCRPSRPVVPAGGPVRWPPRRATGARPPPRRPGRRDEHLRTDRHPRAGRVGGRRARRRLADGRRRRARRREGWGRRGRLSRGGGGCRGCVVGRARRRGRGRVRRRWGRRLFGCCGARVGIGGDGRLARVGAVAAVGAVGVRGGRARVVVGRRRCSRGRSGRVARSVGRRLGSPRLSAKISGQRAPSPNSRAAIRHNESWVPVRGSAAAPPSPARPHPPPMPAAPRPRGERPHQPTRPGRTPPPRRRPNGPTPR